MPRADRLSFFLAGIIQGSLAQTAIHDQDYRARAGNLVRKHFPEASVYDPFMEHPQSLQYDFGRGREVFFDLMRRAARTAVLIAFVPEASMGTAIEMWQAHNAGAVVVCVTPLAVNWVVKYLSDAVVEDLEALEAFMADGGLARLVDGKRAEGRNRSG